MDIVKLHKLFLNAVGSDLKGVGIKENGEIIAVFNDDTEITISYFNKKHSQFLLRETKTTKE